MKAAVESPCVADVNVEKSGWLSKRAHFTLRWRPTWVHLRGGRLMYGEGEQSPVKSIPLVGAELGSTGDPLAWTITPVTEDRRRCFHLRAASPTERDSWMRNIHAAQAGCAQHGAPTCVLQ